MNLALFACNAGVLLVYMSLAFLIARKLGRLDTVDSAWGGGFVVAAWMVAGLETSWRTILIAVLVMIWATRLTSHLVDRTRRSDHDDPRYTELATKWGKQNYWLRAYFSIFILQGLLVLVISSPTVFAAGKDLDWAVSAAIIGSIVWLVGFVVEAIGDRQLEKFISNKANKGKVLNTGLWRYSRHPNYLGEITQWYGIGTIACGASWGWLGLLGPLVLNILIRYVSGVPPIERRKQKDPVYQKYMKSTNAILPKLIRRS